MTTYKAIGFDWGGVLNGEPAKFFGKRISALLRISEDSYRNAYFHHNKEFNRGEITAEELWSRVLDELDLSDQLEKTMEFVRQSNVNKLNKDVLELVDKLRINGYKVGLLSNNTLEKAHELRLSGLDKHFDSFHISAETGHVKPEAIAFTNLSDSLNVSINELIFIDDSQKSLSTAEEIGFTAVLFDNLEQCVDDLKQLGVNI